MTRVLLIDTSFAARPIHDWLLSEGFEVWTIGNRPSDLLARRDPGRYLQENYADVAVVQAHIDRLGISHVVPGCTDFSIATALKLRPLNPGLDDPASHGRLGEKAAFRELCARLDLPAPRRILPGDLPVHGQLIAKPVNSFSGRGISMFDGSNHDDAMRALELARSESHTGDALLETFAEGQLYSYTAFIEGHKVAGATLVHESGSVTPYAVDVSHVSRDFPATGKAVLQTSLERIAEELQLVDGLVHLQFVWDGTSPSIIEASRRCPGDLYPNLIEQSTGLRYAARYASYYVGRPIPTDQPDARRHILRHTIIARHGPYEGVWMNTPTPVIEFHSLAHVGRAPPPSDRIDRVALLFLEYMSHDDLAAAHQSLLNRTHYQTGNNNNN